MDLLSHLSECVRENFTVAGLIFVVLTVSMIHHFVRHGTNFPGPVLWPVVGCIPAIVWNKDRLYDMSTEFLAGSSETKEMRSSSSSFFSKALGLNEIVTADPKILEHVLKTNFLNYPKGPEFQESFRDLLGHGIFNSDGDAWKTQRKTASLEFSAGSLRDLTVTAVRDEVSQRLLPTLREAMSSGRAIDVQELLLRYTFDNICRIGFGVDPGCLAPGLPDIPFASAFDIATKATLVRNILPPLLWRLRQKFQLGTEKHLTDAVEKINEFASGVIKKRRQELSEQNGVATYLGSTDKQKEGNPKHTDLLSRFMILNEQDSRNQFSDSFLRDACTNFILAGRDTSSVALSWFFWLLTWHPHVEAKCMEEINRILDARSGDCVGDETFSFDELRTMHYIQAALTESLRLYPSVPVDTKYVANDDTLPDGQRVYKGWRVTYVAYAMGRMVKIWGEDAAEFRPGRFLGPDGAFRPESPYKYPAFNAGPRLCLGKDMAYVQMKSVASTILRNFKLKVVPGHKIAYTMSLTLFMRYGLLMTVHPRLPSKRPTVPSSERWNGIGGG